MEWVVDHSWLIPLLPLIGAGLAGFFGARWLKQQSHWPIWIGVGLSAVMSICLLVGMTHHAPTEQAQRTDEVGAQKSEPTLSVSRDWFTWIQAGDPQAEAKFAAGETPSFFKATTGALFDPLTAVMLCVVTGIGFLITVF